MSWRPNPSIRRRSPNRNRRPNRSPSRSPNQTCPPYGADGSGVIEQAEYDPGAAHDADGSGVIEQDEWLAAVDCHANHKLTAPDIQAAASARS